MGRRHRGTPVGSNFQFDHSRRARKGPSTRPAARRRARSTSARGANAHEACALLLFTLCAKEDHEDRPCEKFSACSILQLEPPIVHCFRRPSAAPAKPKPERPPLAHARSAPGTCGSRQATRQTAQDGRSKAERDSNRLLLARAGKSRSASRAVIASSSPPFCADRSRPERGRRTGPAQPLNHPS